MDEIRTSLGEFRRKRGLSAVDLAARVGVTRQTIYAIEAGSFIPNTAVALRLAQALEASVEQLFALSNEAATAHREEATLLPDSAVLQAGQAVQLCRFDKRLIASAPSSLPWYLPAADGVIAGRPGTRGKARVQVFEQSEFANRILVAGCDPGMSVLARHVLAAGTELILAHRNSSQALALLRAGCVHVAGTHLRDETGEHSTLPEIKRLFPTNLVAVVTFAVWEEGIVTARNNPKKIKAIEHFARKNISIVNRETGSGSRALLDAQMQRVGLETKRVRGYDTLASGHLSAAWQVQTGAVDCCIATRAAARVLGLGFIPLVSERYDLVIRRRHLSDPRIERFLDTLNRSGVRRELEGLGGYDTRISGQRIL